MKAPKGSLSNSQDYTESLVAAMLFAAHPIHTEAVAGVVGHAELLSAALGFAALLSYMYAAKQVQRKQHDVQLMLAVGLLWSAALSKEIGITMVGCLHMTSTAWVRHVNLQCYMHTGSEPQLRAAALEMLQWRSYSMTSHKVPNYLLWVNSCESQPAQLQSAHASCRSNEAGMSYVVWLHAFAMSPEVPT